jgi:hypothetical protein
MVADLFGHMSKEEQRDLALQYSSGDSEFKVKSNTDFLMSIGAARTDI